MMRKLVLVVVDSLRTDMLHRTVEAGAAPVLERLLERGTLVPDCVSTFPSVTPVANSEIVTGVRPDRHWISAMNWYHRVERRYVEYGSSWEATRTFGLFRSLYDTVYNMNMAHLSPEVDTVFERLGDHGVRTACTPFLVYRGRFRHELGLEGLMRRAAEAARFHHAVWGPDELFYGELYASRKVPCKPTLARPGTRDEYSACVGVELAENDLYDFLLFSLPDNDYHSHKYGPEAQEGSIAHADDCLARLVEAAGGLDAFLADHAVIVMADHSQTAVDRELPLADMLAAEWRVLEPNAEHPEHAELAVSPTARAAGVYVLDEGRRRARTHSRVRDAVGEIEGVELVAWLSRGGAAVERADPGATTNGLSLAALDSLEAVVERGELELRFRPGSALADLRGGSWDLDGDRGVLDLEEGDGRVYSESYPDALGRLWAALTAPHAPDVLLSAAQRWELVDWGGVSHCPGGSHGSLRAGDSLGPLLAVGLDGSGISEDREQWGIGDVAALLLDHFGAGAPRRPGAAGALT